MGQQSKTRKQNNNSFEENKFKIDFNNESSNHKVSNKNKISAPNKKKNLEDIIIQYFL